jgi:hypothetical protein
MPTAESLSLILLCYFSTVTHVLYYAGCSLFAPGITWFVHALKNMRLVVDRFHGMTGHTCSPGFDPHCLPEMATSSTSNFESLNSVVAEIQRSLRYVDPKLFMRYIAFKAALMNLSSRWRQESGKTDLESSDFVAIANRVCVCKCSHFAGIDPTPLSATSKLTATNRFTYVQGLLLHKLCAFRHTFSHGMNEVVAPRTIRF